MSRLSPEKLLRKCSRWSSEQQSYYNSLIAKRRELPEQLEPFFFRNLLEVYAYLRIFGSVVLAAFFCAIGGLSVCEFLSYLYISFVAYELFYFGFYIFLVYEIFSRGFLTFFISVPGLCNFAFTLLLIHFVIAFFSYRRDCQLYLKSEKIDRRLSFFLSESKIAEEGAITLLDDKVTGSLTVAESSGALSFEDEITETNNKEQ